MNTYILIDTSYIIFYRFYAILSWYKKAYVGVDLDIYSKFKKKVIDTILELSKKYNTPFNRIILCFDCPLSSNWRKKIYPKYKETRKENKIITNAFQFFIENIEYELNKLGIISIKIKSAEADDIIAILTQKLQTIFKIIIISSDKDFLQLLNKNTEIITLNNKNLKYDINDLNLELKIIIGDKSDNISGCFKKCGIKTALKYIKEEKLPYLFIKYPESYEIYKLNQKLIDFNFIPHNIKNDILNKISLY